MPTTPARLLVAVASGLLLVACTDQGNDIAAPRGLARRSMGQESPACPTSLIPNDSSCLRLTAPSALGARASLSAAASGSLRIAYINDNADLAGLHSVEGVVAARALGTVEQLTVQDVLDGALDAGNYQVVFHGRDYGGPSSNGTSNPFTTVPVGLRAALDRALSAGVGLITEWQGGSPVWSGLSSQSNYFQVTEPDGGLWNWYPGTVDRGDDQWFTNKTFTNADPRHPVMQGLDPSFQLGAVDFCFRIQNPDPKLQVLATITDAEGASRPVMFAGSRANARVVLWACDWGDNGAADPNVQQWIANAIVWAAEGPHQTTQPVPAGEPATVTITDNGEPVAGIDIPAGTFTEDVTVTVRFVTTTQSAPCHDYLLGQLGRCLQITAVNSAGQPVINNQPMTVGLCLPASVGPRELFKFESRQDTPKALKQTMVPFLDCDGFQVGSAAPSGSLKGLAMGVAKRVGRWLSPAPLYAAHGGFGGQISLGDGLSFFTWAAPLQITQAGLAVNVFNSGQDAYALAGTLNLQPKSFDPFSTESGFSPAAEAVTVAFAGNSYTIPAGSFRFAAPLNRWVYVGRSTSGITAMSIQPTTGAFSVAASVPTGGALPINKSFTVQIGHRTQGLLLVCLTNRLCTAQEAQ